MKTVFLIAAGSVLALAACAPLPPSGPPTDGPDQCMASQYQYLVGQNRSRIPAQPSGATWRVTCTTCPVTMDYNPNRLNIFYNEQSGTVEQVRCG